MTRLARGWKKFWSAFWSALTGEWMLLCGCPNGGTVIFFRSVQVTLILYLIGLWLRSLFIFGVALPWHSHFSLLCYKGVDTFGWIGAIFAAAYAALYARFASQWSYLAGVYNQMREALVRIAGAQTSTIWSCGEPHSSKMRSTFTLRPNECSGRSS